MRIDYAGPGGAGEPGGVLRWVGRGSWAILDQGLFAGTNFLLNVMLARWLSPGEYGAFAVGLAAVFFVGTFHSALLTEPMLVFGPGRYADRAGAYMAAMLWGHAAISAAAVVALAFTAGVCWWMGWGELAVAVGGFALACPFILLLWLARRACYMRLRPHRAALAGAGYLAAIVTGLLVLRQRHWLTLAGAVGVLGAGSAAAAAALVPGLGADFFATRGRMLGGMARAHLLFGRWGVGTGVLYFASGQLMYILLASLSSLDASGGMRALMNLTTPMTLTSFACAMLMSPALVRSPSRAAFERYVLRALGGLVVMAAAYWVVIGLLRRQLFHLAYGDRYADYAPLVWLVGATVVTTAVADVLAGALRARHEPREVFRAFAASAVVNVVAGAVLIPRWGVRGAAVSLVLCGVTAAVILVQSFRNEAGPTGAGPDVAAAEMYEASGH